MADSDCRTPSGVRGALVGTLVCALLCGCAQEAAAPGRPVRRPSAGAQTAAFSVYLASSRRVGRGAGFRPSARGSRGDRGAPIDGMRCAGERSVGSAAHIEIFVADHVVIVPAGIGLAPPIRQRGPHLLIGRCAYPVRTVDPTGLVLSASDRSYTLGQLFAVWGQPLGQYVVAGFHASPHERVRVFVDGRLWQGGPADVPLARHSQVTIELGPYVPPHSSYLFPPPSSVGQ